MMLYKFNNNDLWYQYEKQELDQLYEYGTFRSQGLNKSTRKGYTHINVHMVYDIKKYGRRKAILVSGVHLTGPNNDTYYSSVVSLISMRMVMFIGELDGLEIHTGDIGNSYLEANTDERYFFTSGD